MKIFTKLLSKCTLFSAALICASSLYANSPQLFINNVPTTAECIVKNDTTLVPLRFLTEQMGYRVDWSSKGQPIIISKEAPGATLFASVTVDSNSVNNNGVVSTINQAPIMRNGTVYVPMRFICESFNCSVDYKNNNIYITTSDSNELPETPDTPVPNTPETTTSASTLPAIVTTKHLAYLDSNGCFDFNKYNEMINTSMDATSLNQMLLASLKKIPGFSDVHQINLIFQPTDQSKTLVLYAHPGSWSLDSGLSEADKAKLTNNGMVIELNYDNNGFTVNSVKTIKDTNPTISKSLDSYVDLAINLYKTTKQKDPNTWGYQSIIGNPSYATTGYNTYIVENHRGNDVSSFEKAYKEDLDKLMN